MIKDGWTDAEIDYSKARDALLCNKKGCDVEGCAFKIAMPPKNMDTFSIRSKASSSPSQVSQDPLKYSQDSVSAMCSDPMIMPGCAGGDGSGGGGAGGVGGFF